MKDFLDRARRGVQEKIAAGGEVLIFTLLVFEVVPTRDSSQTDPSDADTVHMVGGLWTEEPEFRRRAANAVEISYLLNVLRGVLEDPEVFPEVSKVSLREVEASELEDGNGGLTGYEGMEGESKPWGAKAAVIALVAALFFGFGGYYYGRASALDSAGIRGNI